VSKVAVSSVAVKEASLHYTDFLGKTQPPAGEKVGG